MGSTRNGYILDYSHLMKMMSIFAVVVSENLFALKKHDMCQT